MIRKELKKEIRKKAKENLFKSEEDFKSNIIKEILDVEDVEFIYTDYIYKGLKIRFYFTKTKNIYYDIRINIKECVE